MSRKQPIKRIAIRKNPLPLEVLAKKGTDTRTHNQLRGELWHMIPGLATATQDTLGIRVVEATLDQIIASDAKKSMALGAFTAELATTLAVTGRILLEHTKWRNQAPGEKTRDMYNPAGPIAQITPGQEVPATIAVARKQLENARMHGDAVVASFTTKGRRAGRYMHRQALGESLLASAITLAPLAEHRTLANEGDPILRSEIGVACFDEIDQRVVSAATNHDILPSLIQLGREEGRTPAETRIYRLTNAEDVIACFATAHAETNFGIFDPRETAAP